MRKVIRLVVVVAVILFQISSGQKVDVPYGTEWQLGLSEYMCTILWNLILSSFVSQGFRTD